MLSPRAPADLCCNVHLSGVSRYELILLCGQIFKSRPGVMRLPTASHASGNPTGLHLNMDLTASGILSLPEASPASAWAQTPPADSATLVAGGGHVDDVG